jgi:hypothetical protein
MLKNQIPRLGFHGGGCEPDPKTRTKSYLSYTRATEWSPRFSEAVRNRLPIQENVIPFV